MSGSSIRIVDMPDLGAFTSNSSVVGEHAGSGRFSATALSGFFLPLTGGTVSGATFVDLDTTTMPPGATIQALQSNLISTGTVNGYGTSFIARVTASGTTTASEAPNNANVAINAAPIKHIPAGGFPAGMTQLQHQWAYLANNYDCSNSPSSIGGVLCSEYDQAANGRDDLPGRCGAQYIFTTLWPVGSPGPDNPFYGPTPATGGWPAEHGTGMLFTVSANAVLNTGMLMAQRYAQSCWDSRQASPLIGTIQTTVAAGGASLHVDNVVGYMSWCPIDGLYVIAAVSPTNPMPVTIGAHTYSVISATFDPAGPGGVTTSMGTLTLASGIIGTDGVAGTSVVPHSRTIWLNDGQQISLSSAGDSYLYAQGSALYINASQAIVNAILEVSGNAAIGGSLNILAGLDLGNLAVAAGADLRFHSSGHAGADVTIGALGGTGAGDGTLTITGVLQLGLLPTNAANDAAAAAAGVPPHGIYRSGSALMIRAT